MEKDTKIVLIVIAITAIALLIIYTIINSNIYKSTFSAPSMPTVYEDIYYGGNSQEYGVGSYNLSQMQDKGTPNDTISSVEIPLGYTVTFFEHDNFQGASITISKSDANLVDDGWNDRVSSIVITKTP